MNDKIDIVILWVDDNDKEWTKKKQSWQNEYGIKIDNKERYRNWDNLKYLFRGIEKYASWVNHVYLVTDNQKPEWLDVGYEKVTVVDHKDIISDEHLPLFNSRAIELNIHKIKNLSENFIYFNDDMFIIDSLYETDFFEKNVPVDIGVMEIIYPKIINSIQKVMINNLGIINNEFNKKQAVFKKPFNWFNYKYGKFNINNLLLMRWSVFTNFVNHHLPIPFNKNTFKIVWNKYNDNLEDTVSYKFRADNNYNIWLMRYWQLASNNFIPRNNQLGKTIQLRDSKDAKKCASIIRKNKYKMICINDNEYTQEFSQSKKEINKSFDKLFIEKSKFEL